MTEPGIVVAAPAPRRRFAGIAAVDHAVAVLKALPASGASIGVNELARRIGLHKSTVSRLLATLERHQFVQREAENGRVSLGIGLVALVSPMLGNLDMMRAAKPVLKKLAAATGETASLALWNGREAVMVEQVIGPRAVVHSCWPGKTVPAHTTASGKVFLAFLPDDAIAPLMEAGFERRTPFTRTRRDDIAADIARCRALGYALNDQENELESCGVAAPVFDFRGELVASLSLAVPKHRFDEAAKPALSRHIVDGARELSRQLGWCPAGAATPL